MSYVSPAWMDDAVCREIGGDVWFPRKGNQRDSRQAVQICRACPVIDECREYALRHNVVGVWGGLTERGRRKIARTA